MPCPSDIHFMNEDSLNRMPESSRASLRGHVDIVSSEFTDTDDNLSDESDGDSGSSGRDELEAWLREREDTLLLSDESDGDSFDLSGDEDAWLNVTGIGFNDFNSDWFILRIKLWMELDYGKDRFLHNRFQQMWQRSFEIETVGWPVLPLRVIVDPQSN